jgi:3-oxoacyl-[acyl-carrier-protein] synthase II
MSKRQIAITGMGLVTPLGGSVEENRLNLEARNCGVGHYPLEKQPEAFQYVGKVTHLPVPPDLEANLSSQTKFLNRGSVLGFAAARQAIAQSGRSIASVPPDRRALYIGAGDFSNVGYEFLFPAVRKATGGKYREVDARELNLASLRDVQPFFLLESIHNNLFSFLSACFDTKGANATLAGASPCGAQALELACRCLQQERADVALVVGCGSWVSAVPRYEMMDLGLLSRCREGIHSFRPFDRRRDGLITGEGGAALVLEAEHHARVRGANIVASVEGTGNCLELSGDAKWGVPARVSLDSMQTALAEAACEVGDLAFICPHGSATVKGDRSELRSIVSLLDPIGSDVPVCGLKGYTSHLGAASDVAEIILGITAIKTGLVPATLNFREAEEEFAELKISNSHQKHDRLFFLSVSYGLGGQCTATLIKGRR